MLINIAEETVLEKDKPAILMSQNAAAMLPHLIILARWQPLHFFFSQLCSAVVSVCRDVEIAEKDS